MTGAQAGRMSCAQAGSASCAKAERVPGAGAKGGQETPTQMAPRGGLLETGESPPLAVGGAGVVDGADSAPGNAG